MSGKQNLAARAGRWSAAHWKTATLAWIAFVRRRGGGRQSRRHGQADRLRAGNGRDRPRTGDPSRGGLLAAGGGERARAEPVADGERFIVSRIKELVDRGESTTAAVEHGIRRTASTVTSAAVVMVAVFGIFASLRTLDIKQLGVGLAVAVLIDATIIRAVLLPATMKLLGEWNWYLPRWLAWLPQLSPEAGPAERPPEAEAAPALD